MNKQPLLYLCITIVLTLTSQYSITLGAQELKPHNVIIQSSYQKQNTLTVFREHTIDLLIPKDSFEPYLPEFSIPQFDPPLDYAHNIHLSGLTRSFGGLSELFLGEQGVLENAFLSYQREEYQIASQKLINMLPLNSPVGEKATLLLAWIKFKDNRWQDSLLYAKAGLQSENLNIVIESTYLLSLILYNQQQYEQLADTIQHQFKTHHLDFWDSRLPLLYLTALAKLNRWSTAFQYLQEVKFERLNHRKTVYLLLELAGNVSYQLKQYEEAQKFFEKARSLNPNLEYRKQLNRKIVWSVYQQEKFKESLDLIIMLKEKQVLLYDEEIHYLLFASQAHLHKWREAQDSFLMIDRQSTFFIPAAFLYQTLSKENTPGPEVEARLKQISYDLPVMLFHAALQKGINAFKAGKYKSSEALFQKALSADLHSNDLYLAQFNLGVSYLKQHNYKQATSTFQNLQQTIPRNLLPLVTYHLLFAYYQTSQSDLFQARLDEVGLNTLPPEVRWEVLFMKANILLADNKYSEAATLFGSIWEMQNKLPALEMSAIALYQAKRYREVLNIKEKQKRSSDTLFIYRIKSLLGLNQFQQALNEIDHLRPDKDELIKLQIEVWLANQKYQEIVTSVGQQLKKPGSAEIRLHYYLSLGDALFNLEQYVESKNQFYKALALTDDPLRKSLIQYNISLIAFHSKDYPSFLKETKVILASKDLAPEIRYNLTQLLVNHYQAQNQIDKVDQILRDYIQDHTFLRTKAVLKRLQLLNQNEQFEQCATLASDRISDEDLYQRRDRLILFGHCGNQAGSTKSVRDKLETELSDTSTLYREKELKYVLANAYFNDREYKKSRTIINTIQRNELEREPLMKTTLLLVDSLVHLKEGQEAKRELGNTSQYRSTAFYNKALSLSAEISLLEDKVDEALRSLLRIHFMKSLPEEKRLTATLRVIEVLVDNNRIEEARKYYSGITPEQLEGHLDLTTRYQTVTPRLMAAK